MNFLLTGWWWINRVMFQEVSRESPSSTCVGVLISAERIKDVHQMVTHWWRNRTLSYHYFPWEGVGLCLISHLYSSSASFFFLFRAAPEAYGRSQARGWIRATAAGLRHSHTATRDLSRVCDHTTDHSNARSLIHWARLGIEPAISWFLVGCVSAASQGELQR